MTPDLFLQAAISLSFGLLIIAFLIALLRLVLGPTLPDRVLALDLFVNIGIGFIAVVTVSTGFDEYLDVAIGLGLVGFLATVAFARFVLHRGVKYRIGEDLPIKADDRRIKPRGRGA